MTHSFIYDGTWLGHTTYGVTVLGYSQHPAGADVRRGEVEQGGADGDVDFARYLGSKHLTMECVIAADSYADYEAKLDRVRVLLDPREGLRLLVLDHQNHDLPESLRRGFYARVDGPIYDTFYLNGGRFQLNWYIPSGKSASLTTVTRTGIAISGTMYEPSGASDVVWGTDNALPVWTITASGASTATVTLVNNTTLQTFRWTGTLATGDALEIDSERQHCQKIVSGLYSNAMRYVTGSDPFPVLAAGYRNAIEVTGVTGTLGISYVPRFL